MVRRIKVTFNPAKFPRKNSKRGPFAGMLGLPCKLIMQYFSSILDGMIYFFNVFITVKYQIKVDKFINT